MKASSCSFAPLSQGNGVAVPKTKYAIVVDDDKMVAAYVGIALSQLHYKVVVCSDFEHALDLMEQSKADLIVTDIYMPGIGGIEGIRIAKKKYPDTTVFAMSGGWNGMSSENTIKAAKLIGADSGLEKPVTVESVIQLVESFDGL
jgi:DNA-binding response OmpR family regulator